MASIIVHVNNVIYMLMNIDDGKQNVNDNRCFFVEGENT